MDGGRKEEGRGRSSEGRERKEGGRREDYIRENVEMKGDKF